jgi:hypothetical protein
MTMVTTTEKPKAPKLNKGARAALRVAKQAIVEEGVSEHPQWPKRCAGRPPGGRATFGAKQIIARMSLRQWCKRKTNPLPCAVQDGRQLFTRDVLIKWLQATGRYPTKKG